MNKNNNYSLEFKELKRKYFIKNKIREGLLGVIIIIAVVFIPYLLGLIVLGNEICITQEIGIGGLAVDNAAFNFDECSGRIEKTNIVLMWVLGALMVMGIFVLVMTLNLIIKMFLLGLTDFIEYNWKKAEEQAREELKNREEEK